MIRCTCAVRICRAASAVIPEGMFSRCIGLTGIVIPDSVREIQDEAFYQCSNLDTVVIPDSVGRIGRCAFLNVRRVVYHGSAKGFPWARRGATEKGGKGT